MNTANLCIFEGRIARDPQYSSFNVNTQNGQQTVEKALFTIAVDRVLTQAQRQKVKAGDNSIKTTDFIPCSLVGAQVSILRQFFFKGKGIRVVGHYSEYQTKDQQTGETKYGHNFEIDSIGFCIQDPKQQGDAQQQNNGYNNEYGQNNNGYNQNNNGYTQNNNAQVPNNSNNVKFTMFDANSTPF